MIRVIQRRLIIPRGDTGTFSLPILGAIKSGDVAVFSIFDTLTRETVFEKEIELSGEEETLSIPFTRKETINLTPKKYLWDVKIYVSPVRNEDGILVDGEEINSYYGAFSLPICEVKEVAEDVSRQT